MNNYNTDSDLNLFHDIKLDKWLLKYNTAVE